MKTQRKIPGMRRIRIQLYGPEALFDAIDRDRIRWNSSFSWITTTAACAFYGIDIETPMVAKVGNRREQHGAGRSVQRRVRHSHRRAKGANARS